MVAVRTAPVAPRRVAKRDRPAQRIDLGRVEAELLDDRKALRRECLVQFDPVDRVLPDARAAQDLGNRRDRAHAHDLGRDSADGEADPARKRREAQLLQHPFTDHDRRTRAVRGLRAVARGHRALGRKHRLELGQAVGARIAARALVAIEAALARDDLARCEIGHIFADRIRRDLGGELAARLGGERLAVTRQREGVLLLARHLPPRGDPFRGQPHAVGDAEVLVLGEHLGVEREPAEHRDHAHALGAGGDDDVGLAGADAVGGDRDRVQPGGAEAIDRHPRHAVRQPGEQQTDARDVHALFVLGHGAADDHVLDALRLDLRYLHQDTLQDVRQQRVGAGMPERAPRGLADRCARRGDDVRILQLLGHAPSVRKFSSSAACRS